MLQLQNEKIQERDALPKDISQEIISKLEEFNERLDKFLDKGEA